MRATSEAYLDRLLDPLGKLLSRDVATRLVELRSAPEVQARLDELAEAANEGVLTAQEKSEYETYIQVIEFLLIRQVILQAKARSMLASREVG